MQKFIIATPNGKQEVTAQDADLAVARVIPGTQEVRYGEIARDGYRPFVAIRYGQVFTAYIKAI